MRPFTASRKSGSASPEGRLARRVAATAAAVALTALAVPAADAQETAAADGTRLTEELLEPFGFRFIGPSNMSGRITAFAVPDEPLHKTIYAGMASGGVWKTTNAGVTWEPIWDDQPFSSIGDVAVAPSDHDVVWVGTGERNSLRSASWGNGVYKSTDGGSTWEHMGLEESRMTGRIAIHPENPEIVYVAAQGHLWGANPERGVYKTTDGGESWEKVLFVNDTTGFVDLKMHPENPDVLFAAGWHRVRWGGGHMEGAGAGSGIWKTTDGGATWTELTEPGNGRGLPSEKLGRIGLGIHPETPDRMYAVIQVAHGAKRADVSPFGGLFRSDDGGESWERVNDLSAIPDYYYNEVWLDPDDPERVYLAQTRLHVSEDGGETIAPVRMSRVHVDHHAMWIDPDDPEHIVLGNDGGVYISYDRGETWAHQVVPAAQFYEVDVDTTKVPYHVCGGMQDNGTWCGPNRTREGAGITDYDWYNVFGGDGFHSAVSPDSPNIRYAEFQYGNLFRMNTETAEADGLQPIAEDAGAESGYAFRWDWNTPLVLSRHDPTRIYYGGNFLFRMTDRGEDWKILGPDMTRQNRHDPEPEVAHTSYHSLHSVAESALDERILWAGSNDGLLWVSTDGGDSWTNVTGNLPAQEATECFVSEIEPSHFDSLTAYTTHDCHRRDDYRPYVFRTSDGGGSWTDITGDLPDDAGSYVVREDYRNPDLLYVGTEKGLFVSNTGGGEWVRLKNDLPAAPVRDMELVPRTGELVVATFGRSVYILDVWPLQELTPEVLASDAHLFRVKDARIYEERNTYGSFGDQFFHTPNPPYGTAVWYYLAEDQGGDVRIAIKRMEEGEAGETINTLTGSGRPGIHRVQWDLTRSSPRPRELDGPTSRQELMEVRPGTFQVSLTVGEETMTREVTVEEGWVERTPGRMR